MHLIIISNLDILLIILKILYDNHRILLFLYQNLVIHLLLILQFIILLMPTFFYLFPIIYIIYNTLAIAKLMPD